MPRICVFTGSRIGADPVYEKAAVETAIALVDNRAGLVYGGGRIGLMGILADAVLARGGEVIGVIPEMLMDREVGHLSLSELHIVKSMHQRKEKMAALSDGFIAMPGGLGTLEELFEAMTWSHLGIHEKRCGLLNTNGYYNALIGFLQHGVEQDFITDSLEDLLIIDDQPVKLLEHILEDINP